MIFTKLFRRHSTPAKAPEGSTVLNKIKGEISRRQAEVAELEALHQLVTQRDNLQTQITVAEQQLASLGERQAAAESLLEKIQKSIGHAQNQRDAIMLDVPAEVRNMRDAVAAAVAIADQIGSARCAFLASRGWENRRVGWGKPGGPTLTNESAAKVELAEAVAKLSARPDEDWALKNERAAALV